MPNIEQSFRISSEDLDIAETNFTHYSSVRGEDSFVEARRQEQIARIMDSTMLTELEREQQLSHVSKPISQ